MPLAEDVSQTIDFLKNHSLGLIILILMGIELLIDFLDFLGLLFFIVYIDALILGILDLAAFFALYLFFTSGKVLNEGGTDEDVWGKIFQALVYIFVIEIIYGVVMVAFDYIPTILYWITIICPLISLILAFIAKSSL